MYGAYRAGKTILCHSSDFTKSGLIETSVCHDNTDGCIAGKLVFYDRIASIHILDGWTKAGLFPVQHTGNHFPCFPVINVTQRVYCDQCSNLQLTNLDGMASYTGFHAIAHPPILSDRCPCTRTVVSISIVSFFRRDASGIRHMGIGTDSTISNGQIKQARLAYKGDFGHSYVKPDVPFLQITHHPTSRIQTKRTSSAQHDRVYFVGACKRRKQACLSRCGSTSANIQPSRCASIANDNRTPCSRAEFFRLSNSDIFNIFDRNLPHGVPSHQADRNSFIWGNVFMIFSVSRLTVTMLNSKSRI